MTEDKSYDEIQSKTVLLEDNEGINDMLSALNKGRAALDKKKKEIERAKKMRKIALIFSIVTIVISFTAALIYILTL